MSVTSVLPPAVLELASRDQWVVWKEVEREGKATKPPYQPAGPLADSTKPTTWVRYDVAQQALTRGGWQGSGYVFSPDDPYAGVDLDGCRDPATGQIAEWAQTIIDSLNSYTEISPSGTGVKVFVRGKLPADGHKKNLAAQERICSKAPAIEMYDRGRYFTVTGLHLSGTPTTIEDRTPELAGLHARLFAAPARSKVIAPVRTSTAILDDLELLRIAFNANNGAEIRALWDGSTAKYGQDDSAADCALLAHLAFYTGDDPGRLDRLFRQSGLYRDKWERADYRERTIRKAVSGLSQTYSSSSSSPRLMPSSNGTAHQHAPALAALRPAGPPWPKPLVPEALYGLAGELVRAIMPHSEADPAALLAHVLPILGVFIGPHVHAVAGDASHPPRINTVVVGETSKGRKGTSAQPVLRAMRLAEDVFTTTRILQGLSSGEGLIWQVRDPITKRERVKQERGGYEYQDVEADAGVNDKRLVVLEPEFASVLRMLQRDGNTLSAIVRLAWDSGDLRTLTKNSPAVATGAHVGIVGHVTRDELLRYLDRSELASGFANRFLWFAAKRAQVLPDGERTPDDVLQPFAEQLADVSSWARMDHWLRRDDDATALWHEVYPELSEGAAGLFGAATSRAEAQVLRLSVLYAALDCSLTIRAEHVLAGLAVWQYAEESARWIFGDATGDPTADTILSTLRQGVELSRSDLVDLFGRNVSRPRIEQALGLLLRHGLATMRRDTETGGRPREVWRAA